jgi:amidase
MKCLRLASLLPLFLVSLAMPRSRGAELDLTAATIPELDAALNSGALTSEKLVQLYQARIAAYDKQGPMINAVITLNPKALDEAKALDAERKITGPRSAIHGIPIVLKDNYNTFDLPTTGGSQVLQGSIPSSDAFVVKKLREAGAIILAKVNMSEFASGGGAPNGFSSMGGQTRNPHDLTKGPAGSSGGTGASMAAAFAQFGMGTDTGGSIRGPSSVNGIVGLKPTRGLLSRNGIIPLTLSLDTGGPMARSVTDIAIALGIMTGIDPADDATRTSSGKFYKDYTQFLKVGALRGARIGVARDFFGRSEDTDKVMEAAIVKLKALGATVVDPVKFPTYFMDSRRGMSSFNTEFKAQIAVYLSTLKPGYPKTLEEIIAKAEDPKTGYTSPWKLASLKRTLEAAQDFGDPTYQAIINEGYGLVRATVLAVMAKNHLDALIYPTSAQPATEIGTGSLTGDRAGGQGGAAGAAGGPGGAGGGVASVANQTGFPDLIVPAGLTKDGLPVTISFFGPAYSEAKLIGYGYDFEQATKARVLPKNTPKLSSDTLSQ